MSIVIQIKVLDKDNQIIVKSESFDFESAGEALGKLERYIEKLKQ